MIYGYARVSSEGQDTGIQEEALKAAGAEVVRAEKVSGTSRKGRSELETLIQFMRSGDVLLVTRIDRLARSVRDLSNIVSEIEGRAVSCAARNSLLIRPRRQAGPFSKCSGSSLNLKPRSGKSGRPRELPGRKRRASIKADRLTVNGLPPSSI